MLFIVYFKHKFIIFLFNLKIINIFKLHNYLYVLYILDILTFYIISYIILMNLKLIYHYCNDKMSSIYNTYR